MLSAPSRKARVASKEENEIIMCNDQLHFLKGRGIQFFTGVQT